MKPGEPGPPAERPASRAPRRDQALLDARLRDVDQARSQWQAGRRRSPSQESTIRDVERLAEALQRYADALASAGAPLPYRCRDELLLYRAMGVGSRSGILPSR